MSDLPQKPRSIRLRSFYGFSPEEDGYLGWSQEADRDRMLELIEDGDFFMIYGAVSIETAKNQRHRILGFLQVEARAILDVDKSSALGMTRKKDDGHQDNWRYAIPVIRAWRAEEVVPLHSVATETYSPEAGQPIARWSPELTASEIDRAMRIRVTEVSVFGEPPVQGTLSPSIPFEEVFRPSRAFPGSFGTRTATYEDGPTNLYLAKFDGDGSGLMGLAKQPFDKSSLIKIGVSNDVKRRVEELNCGFPPAAKGKWKIEMTSPPYANKAAAEAAEQAFKDRGQKELTSLGGEFFRGDWVKAQSIFASVPGVSRFGGK